MIKFINAVTGGEMWVADDRKEEYVKAGHKVADEPKKAEKPAKKTTRKKAVKE